MHLWMRPSGGNGMTGCASSRELGCRLDKRGKQGVGLFRAGGELRLEKCGYKKWVPDKFHRAGFAAAGVSYEIQTSRDQLRLIGRVELVIAEIVFDDLVTAIKLLQQRTRFQADAGNRPAELGAVLGQGASKGRNDDVRGVGIVLSAVRARELQDISRTLYQSVLEAASGADERPVAGADKFDGAQHAVETEVRAAGRGQQAVKALQFFFAVRFCQRGRGYPFHIHSNTQLSGRMLECGCKRRVGVKCGIKVANHTNSHRVIHQRSSSSFNWVCYRETRNSNTPFSTLRLCDSV